MRHKKQFWILPGAVVLLTTVCTTAFAQLTATEIVSNFNSMNGGQGFVFDNQTSDAGNVQRLTTGSGYSNFDTSDYHPLFGSTNFFQTFSIQPSTVVNNGTAMLNYNAVAGTTTTANGTALSYGAALLYSKYATGSLVVTDGGAYEFYEALNTLTGNFSSDNWATNNFLLQLRSMESNTNYWTRSYDPGLIYSETGNYSVFIVQMTDWSDSSTQNVLYITRSTGPAAPDWVDEPPPPPSGVPEPAMLLFWTFGSLGLTGTSWFRHRNKVKLAFA